jgi:hypothetical protein
MKHFNFLCMAIQLSIRNLWSVIEPPPKSDICIADINQAFTDSKEISSWLANKKYEQISEGNEIETYMPFYYLSHKSSAYYMAGYMNYILTEYTNDPIHITQLFGFDHLLDFMISSQFNNVFSRLTENQKIIVLAFLELVLALRLNDLINEKIESALIKIVELNPENRAVSQL